MLFPFFLLFESFHLHLKKDFFPIFTSKVTIRSELTFKCTYFALRDWQICVFAFKNYVIQKVIHFWTYNLAFVLLTLSHSCNEFIPFKRFALGKLVCWWDMFISFTWKKIFVWLLQWLWNGKNIFVFVQQSFHLWMTSEKTVNFKTSNYQ